MEVTQTQSSQIEIKNNTSTPLTDERREQAKQVLFGRVSEDEKEKSQTDTGEALKKQILTELQNISPETEASLSLIQEYIQRFGEAGGSLAEIFTKLPKTVDQRVYQLIMNEWQKQQAFISEQEILDLLKINVFSEVPESENPEQVRLEMLGKRIYDYTVKYHENLSLLKRIKQINPLYEETFHKAIDVWDKERRRDLVQEKAEQIEITSEAIQEAIDVQSISNGIETDPITTSLELENPRIERKGQTTTVEGIDQTTKERKRFFLEREFIDVLPALLWIELGANLVSGKHHSELMMLVRNMEEMTTEVKSNEQILLSIQAPPESIRLLQQGKAHEQFFQLFRGKEDRLLSFFEKISRNSDNMYVFLQNMKSHDIEMLCKHYKLPGGIFLQPWEVDEYILSKLSKYQKAALGIDENWRNNA